MTAADLESWLEELEIDVRECSPLPGDLSQRRYFRIVRERGGSLLAAHYPGSLRAAMARFVAAQSLLSGAGVRVPGILQSSFERGWMLIEDLGTETLFDLGGGPSPEGIGRFHAAVQNAGRIAGLDVHEVERLGNPPLDEALLRRELAPTFEFLFDPRGLADLAAERQALLFALDELCARLGRDRLVPCHRDFMSRNLMAFEDGVAVIDFQDLRLGPPAYDLASLLNDSFFPGPELEGILLPERWRAGDARDQYSRAVVQRALKAAGTFARFSAQGNPRHVPLIAPTLMRAVRHLEVLPETSGAFRRLRGWWTSHLVPGTIC